ncbi:hypothetical protein EVAR_93355_1 [Eumeta japonica]|uniref:Uncharacterized protein n=1 Tax=Eumeta variegata TaxID=151549 RepID=A0A4C1USZ1_EUMVA|nr:hypothetical protein EVAR_93355_1 [Eumeta japonica]
MFFHVYEIPKSRSGRISKQALFITSGGMHKSARKNTPDGGATENILFGAEMELGICLFVTAFCRSLRNLSLFREYRRFVLFLRRELVPIRNATADGTVKPIGCVLALRS